MINKKIVTSTISVLLWQSVYMPFVLAQSGNPAPLKTDSEAWPWMDPSSAQSAKTEIAPQIDSTQVKTPPASLKKIAPEIPRESAASAQTASFARKEVPKLAAPENGARGMLHAEQGSSARPKSTMLFGRIEQLTAGAGAQFPNLKAQTAKMDTRSVTLKATASDTVFSGEVVRSFPTSFEGQYGGKLQLSMVQTSPLYAQVRAAEAAQATKLMHQGLEGTVNVSLVQTGSEISLQPLQIYCSAPMADSRLGGAGMDSIPGMGSLASMGAMGQMMKTMMASMPYTFVISLGNINGIGVGGQGVQGSVIKETIHQLSPTVIEQDLITTEQSTDATSGRVTGRGYSESVVRVTRYDQTRLFIQAASVDYNYDKRFLRKMLFQGYVTKGQVEQTVPMGGDIQKLLPPGFNPMNPGGGNGSGGENPFKGLFGQ
ncbi:MAG: hypothetical protein P4L53_01075 [Candidatus Obscuribacterales bacterium]|nr:hypothetical protein [Candidatus Obscuribacterales bacterium]